MWRRRVGMPAMEGSVRLIALVIVLAAAAITPSAQAPTEIRVWTARAIATVLAEIGPQFERTGGYRLNVVSDLPAGFLRRAAAGEPVDVIISVSSVIDNWIADGR